MNKCATMLAAPIILATGLAMGLAIGLSSLSAQQAPRPDFSADAAAERIPNLGTLKTELKEYHDCTCKCGCYAHDLVPASAGRKSKAARETGADSGH